MLDYSTGCSLVISPLGAEWLLISLRYVAHISIPQSFNCLPTEKKPELALQDLSVQRHRLTSSWHLMSYVVGLRILEAEDEDPDCS